MNNIIDDNNFLDKFSAIIKFGAKDHLESLQKGKLYMKNLKYYNDLEEKEGNVGIGDKYDGKFILSEMQIELTNKLTNDKISFNSPQAIFDFNYSNNPVFCTFLLDKRNILDKEPTIEGNIIKYKLGFSNEQKRKIKSDFGDSALLVVNTDEFIKRIRSSLFGLGIISKMGVIKYYDKSINQLDRFQDIMIDNSQCVFWKVKSLFEYQHEFRIICLNKEVNDNFEVDIGNIEDITKLVPINEILDGEQVISFYGKHI